jgi:hypothetical protein
MNITQADFNSIRKIIYNIVIYFGFVKIIAGDESKQCFIQGDEDSL